MFSQIAPTLPLSHSDRHWQDDLLTLGRVTHREQQAQQVIQDYNKRMTDTKEKFKALQGKQLLLLSISGLDSIEVFTKQTFAGNLLEELGFELVLPKLPVRYGAIPISLELLPQSLPAYQAKQVYFVDYHFWSRITGPIATELVIEQLQQLLDL
uniref:ABC transporter substrate-binding protein n=1 Tax=Chroococcidiopsis sp. TS-821 TaxID=1378066 RepID=UPI0021118877|nr:ABC transporter substrate-binding protein [Chroococcidiopsis sp. TS-821]